MARSNKATPSLFCLLGLPQFRTAYVVPSPSEKVWLYNRKEPSGLAPGEMVFDTKFIAQNYMWSLTLVIDVMCAIPLPQVRNHINLLLPLSPCPGPWPGPCDRYP